MKKLIILALLCSFYKGYSQPNNPVILNFKAVQIDSHILISFTLTIGNTCNGTVIERSSDSLYFNSVGEISGVCGSASVNTDYSFTDYQPLANVDNYYRLDLRQLGLSEIVKVHFYDFKDRNYVLATNPCHDNCTLFFNNNLHEERTLNLYSPQGELSYQVISKSSSFDLLNLNLNKTVYFFTVSRKGQVLFSGKIVFV